MDDPVPLISSPSISHICRETGDLDTIVLKDRGREVETLRKSRD
jgi:hypothetical protein